MGLLELQAKQPNAASADIQHLLAGSVVRTNLLEQVFADRAKLLVADLGNQVAIELGGIVVFGLALSGCAKLDDHTAVGLVYLNPGWRYADGVVWLAVNDYPDI